MMNGKREQEATAAAAGSAQTTTCTAKQQLINNRCGEEIILVGLKNSRKVDQEQQECSEP
jgi:hypothetical protein